MLLFAMLFVTLTTSFANAESACSFETKLKPLCDEIEGLDKNQSDELPRLWHGSQLPSKKTLLNQVEEFNQRPTNAKLTNEEKVKFSAALLKAKAHAERILLLGQDRQTLRAESELSESEKSTLERIRKITLSNLENPLHATICQDQGHIGHAVTSPEIIICPILFGYSEAALVNAVGTFIGRGLTECASTLPRAFGATMDPISWESHPFKVCSGNGCTSLQQCLRNGSDGQVRKTSSAEIDFDSDVAKMSLTSLQKANSAPGKPTPSIDQLKKALTPMIRAHPSCFHQYNGSQEDSAMSYWFGAETAASYIAEEEKAGRKTDRVGAFAYFVDDACRFHKLKDIRAINGHPTHEARFEKAMLRSSGFRSLLGCAKPPSEPIDCTLDKPELKNEKPAPGGAGSPNKQNGTTQ